MLCRGPLLTRGFPTPPSQRPGAEFSRARLTHGGSRRRSAGAVGLLTPPQLPRENTCRHASQQELLHMCSSPKSQAPSPGETNPERPGGAALKLPKQKPRTLGLCFTAQPRAHLSPPGHVSLAGILVKRRNSLVFPAHRQQPWHIPKGLLVPGGSQRGLSLSPQCQRGSGGRSGAGRCGLGELGTGAAALP